MRELYLTQNEAKRFMLYKQGLLGERLFYGKEGVMQYVMQAGCIQYDPVDVCGMNAELILLSRVDGFKKNMLSELIYADRRLVYYTNGNSELFPMVDWAKFSRIHSYIPMNQKTLSQAAEARPVINDVIKTRGFVSEKDLRLPARIQASGVKRQSLLVGLRVLFNRGELVEHHHKGLMKYYALSERMIPDTYLKEQDPFANEDECLKWRIGRRVGAVGLLWNRKSLALHFLERYGMKKRQQLFDEMVAEEALIRVLIDGFKPAFYMLATDHDMMYETLSGVNTEERLDFIAPKDNLLWDRELVKTIFGFDGRFGSDQPKRKTVDDPYFLSILYDGDFVGQIELINDIDTGRLVASAIRFEPGWKPTNRFERCLNDTLERHMTFNHCATILKAWEPVIAASTQDDEAPKMNLSS